MGPLGWKALYSVISIAGFVLIAYGYGLTREAPVDLWAPPVWTRHLASLLTLPVFVLVAAAYVPGTRIKAALGHPMILGVKAWALAHLLSNGRLADVILFGSFLAWAILDYRAARKRDRQQGVDLPRRGGREGHRRRRDRDGRLGRLRHGPARPADRGAALRLGLGLAHVVALLQRHALVAQDRVGGRHVEVELGHGVVEEVLRPADRDGRPRGRTS